MNEIQDSGINQLLTRRLTITDGPAPASTLAPEVMPVILVAPPSQEDYLFRGDILCGGGGDIPAVVAEHNCISVYNPAASALFALIDEVMLVCGTAATFPAGISPLAGPLGGTLIASGYRDGRLAPSTTLTQTQCGLYKGSSGVTPFGTHGKQVAFWRLPADTILVNRPQIVIPPGYRFDVWCNTTNLAWHASIFWRERRAQPSELV